MENKIDVETFFESYILRAKEKEANLQGVNGTLQFDFRQSGDGIVVIEIKDGVIQPLQRRYDEQATMTIVASYEDFYKVKTGQMKPWKLFLFRKVKILGDKTFTMKLKKAGID